MLLAVTAGAPASTVVSGRMAAPAPAAAVVPMLPRGGPGVLGRGRLRDGLAAWRGPAALGAAVLVTRHLAHLDEAAVEAGQVLQGAVVLHVAALILSRRGTERVTFEHQSIIDRWHRWHLSIIDR